MSAEHRLPVVLCWHMHQPQYLDPISGKYRLPWTYLHGIKDYVDMAAHLEQVQGARAVVNFTPTLLEQLDHYAASLDRFVRHAEPLPDPLLQGLAAEELPTEAAPRLGLLRACLRANQTHLVDRFEPFHRLALLAQRIDEEPGLIAYVTDQFLFDLLAWYHLAWLGESVRRDDGRARMLMEKGGEYSSQERRALVALIGELLAGIVPRYRRLAESGRVELSVTPYAHPIAPLLLDPASAREAVPDLPLPSKGAYPGGAERMRWHIREGLQVFEKHFGFAPKGCWPGEGAVSDATLHLLDEAGFRWTASGGQVLRNSMRGQPVQHEFDPGHGCDHRGYRVRDHRLACFFRDDGLSDLIGFTYSTWHSDDAVANLIHHLENIARACKGRPNAVVAIVLDGENAWEHYPNNGHHFLDGLYRGLAGHRSLELSTFSDCLDAGMKLQPLEHVVAGSWVYGNLTTWVGHADKNRAWDMLIDAKQLYDEVIAEAAMSTSTRRQAERQLAICEGSDWFWWFGDDNPTESVRDFDVLYREHLTRLYQILEREPPAYLAHPFSRGGGHPAAGGVMRPGIPTVNYS